MIRIFSIIYPNPLHDRIGIIFALFLNSKGVMSIP
jgi:hypothetical protein